MTITNKNRPLLHQRVAQLMNPPTGSLSVTDGALMVGSDDGLASEIYVQSSSPSNALYDGEADSFMPIAASGNAIGAGACAYRSPWSGTYTATGGSTTTITYSGSMRSIVVGATVNFLTGANAGRSTTVTDVIVDNATTTLVITAVASAVANTDTFRMSTGRMFVLMGSNQNSFKSYDIATNTWSASLTGSPVNFSTDGRLTGVYNFNEAYATGTATAGTTNTLSNSAKSWTTNQWTNYQVRITAGTGLGQIRVISSNTGTQLTVVTNWTTTPDATSVYAIEGDEDKLYLAGNNATAFYRYSISANTWTTLTPTTALTTNRGTGMFLHFIGKSNDADWSTESVNRDGRYIWSLAGGSTSIMNRYDIVLNTWVNGITVPTMQTVVSFASGSMSCVDGRYIYYTRSNTGLIYRFDAVSQSNIVYCNISFLSNTTTVGNRMFLIKMSSDPTVKWIYIHQGPNLLFRQLIY